MSGEVLIRRHGAVGHISLNRPKALHSLTQAMCEEMTAALVEWAADDTLKAVILDHAEGRGFCAGGDIAVLRKSVTEGDGDGKEAFAFFHAEYRLNHAMFTFPKPIVAFMDGVTMGGGVGIALPCSHRVASERTMFAMPEGSIGLFTDVGAGYYLPRLPGRIGRFMALTGARLDGAECLWAGLATHYIASEQIDDAKARLLAGEPVEDVLASSAPPSPPEARIAGNAEKIDHLFAPDTLEGILAALEGDPSDWAAKELKTLQSKCPMSSKVALRLAAQGARIEDFAEEMELEYRLATRMIMRPDFAEGVRAVIVDKDNAPAWKPADSAGITEAMLDEIFAEMPENRRWTPLDQAGLQG